MNKIGFAIGLIFSIVFSCVTIKFWNELGEYLILLIGFTAFFIWYTVWHYKSMSSYTEQENVKKNYTITQMQPKNISSKVEIIFCNKCGCKLISDSAFCHRCGSKIVIPPINQETTKEAPAEVKVEQKQTATTSVRPTDKDDENAKKLVIGMLIIVLALLITAVIVANS